MAFYTTSQAARHVRVSASTIRNYTNDFQHHFSETATPDEGGRRSYDDNDIAKLRCIAHFKQQNKPDNDIHAALDAGEWLDHGATSAGLESTTSELMLRVTAALKDLENEREKNAELLQTLQTLQNDYKETNERLIEASERAAAGDVYAADVKRLRAKLEQIESKLQQEQGKSWWDKFRGR